MATSKTSLKTLFLGNAFLKSFIEKVKISQERKNFLLSKLPQMEKEERLKLFNVLVEIFLLDLKEKKEIERIKKYWRE